MKIVPGFIETTSLSHSVRMHMLQRLEVAEDDEESLVLTISDIERAGHALAYTVNDVQLCVRCKKKYICFGLAYLRTLRMNSCDEYLFDAVRAGRVFDVSAAIASGANVNATDSSGQRPLNVAAAFAHRFDCMIELLLRGADVNVCDSTTRMPLHVAVITGSASAIVALLNAGAAVNAVTKHDDHGITPLEYICYRDVDDLHTASIVQALVAAGADVNRGAPRPWRGTVNTVYVTPLVSSIAMGSEKAVMALMDANANMPSDSDFACLMQYNVVAELARKVQAEKAWRASARCTWITACLALRC